MQAEESVSLQTQPDQRRTGRAQIFPLQENDRGLTLVDSFFGSLVQYGLPK